MIFDIMHLDGHSALEVALQRASAARSRAWSSPGRTGRRRPSETGGGAAILAGGARRRARGRRGEAASTASTGPAGGTRAGVKVKNFRTQSVVIGGWAAGQGRLEGDLGALLLRDPGRRRARLTWDGSGPGSRTRTGSELVAPAQAPAAGHVPVHQGAVPRSEAAGVTWVEPKLVGEVRFTEWTRTGRLRQPSWRGLRPDQRPEEVVREP